MAGRVRTWVWVVVAVVVVGILGVVTMAGVGLYFVSQHFDTKTASAASAAEDFDEVKARFKEQSPLIELDERGNFRRSNTNRVAKSDAPAPEKLNVLAFDPDDGRIVRLSIPFWLLRLKLRGATVDFNGNKMDLEDLRLSVEDLERFGPTLIVDHKGHDGERVLVWSQ